jgi:hypothetical protein
MKTIIASIVGVLLASAIGAGAYLNKEVNRKLPRDSFEQHVRESNQKFDRIQQEIQRQRESIEEKLDDIQERL